MTGVAGAVDVTLEQQTEVPFVRFVLNRSAIARYGLRAGDVGDAVETALAGATVGHIFDGATGFHLVVKFDPGSQADFARLGDLPIDTPRGGTIPIKLVADVRREVGPNMVLRENVQRRIVISANVAGRDLGGVVADMRAAVSRAVPMPAGYRVEYGGQFESEQAASQRLLILGAGRGRRPVHAAGAGVRRLARRLAGDAQPAAGADRRRRRRVPGRRHAEHRLDDRLHHALRHRHPERHHAGVAHPAPDAARGRDRPARRPSSAARGSG